MRAKGLFGLSARKAPAVLAAAALLGFGGAALADGGADHQVEQTGTILLGTSVSNINDFGENSSGDIFCCGGTLGALVTDGLHEYILSANHVLARLNLNPETSFTSVNPKIDHFGTENIIHPGLIDQGNIDPDGTANSVCKQDTDDTVANMSAAQSDFVEIEFTGTVTAVDAAIALVTSGAVSEEILDIGLVSTTTVPAAETLNMRVKKSGRTTGLTSGKIRANNVSVDVTYTLECASDVTKTAHFVGQLLVWGGGFSRGGDSGSLVVEKVDVAPRPVGLLFAGSQVSTLLNPIEDVLDAFDVTIVGTDGGGTPPPPDEEGGGPPPCPPRCPGGPNANGAASFGLEVASAVKQRHDDRLFGIPGVVGTGISMDDVGNPVIEIYVDGAKRAVGPPIPQALEGIPVRVVETGRFIAY